MVLKNNANNEPVSKLIGCAPAARSGCLCARFWDRFESKALAVFQAFSLAKLRNLRLLSQNRSFEKANTLLELKILI
jgi:hypothetical protein